MIKQKLFSGLFFWSSELCEKEEQARMNLTPPQYIFTSNGSLQSNSIVLGTRNFVSKKSVPKSQLSSKWGFQFTAEPTTIEREMDGWEKRKIRKTDRQFFSHGSLLSIGSMERERERVSEITGQEGSEKWRLRWVLCPSSKRLKG